MRTAFSAGQNDGGQLGMPDAIQHRTPNPILGIKEDVLQVAAGGMHSVVLTNTGLYTFGVGDEYATGRSDNDRNPVLVFPNFKGKDISKIAAGDNLTAFIYKDNLYVFGTFRGENGVIGVNNDVLIQQKPEQIFLGVNESESAKDIAVGDNHVVVLCHSGNVYAFGRSDNYQTGYRTSTRHNNRWCSTDYPIIKNIQLIGAGAHHCIFVTTTFDIYTCGINGFGQLGIPTRNLMQQLVKNSELTLFFKQLNDPLIQVDGSNDNSFFLTKDGKVFAIGKCTFGLVGTKVKNSDHTIEPQLLDFKYPIKSIAAGGSAALALTQDQIVYSWGEITNHATAHGIETDEDIYVPLKVPGKKIQHRQCHGISINAQHSLFIYEAPVESMDIELGSVDIKMNNKDKKMDKKATTRGRNKQRK